MKYFSVTQKCPACQKKSVLFIKEPPRSDKLYSYTCSQCNKYISFTGGAGIGHNTLPENAQVISRTQ